MIKVPEVSSFTAAPLRNRVRIEVNATAAQVWELIGDLARFPEYSAGLERVEATVDSRGRCTEYVCHFKPMEPGGERIVARERMRWWEPQRGHASSGAGSDAFGLSDDLHLVLIEPQAGSTLIRWEEYYDAQDLPVMKAHFDEALADIAGHLIRRFGGKMLERYLER